MINLTVICMYIFVRHLNQIVENHDLYSQKDEF